MIIVLLNQGWLMLYMKNRPAYTETQYDETQYGFQKYKDDGLPILDYTTIVKVPPHRRKVTMN